MKVETLSFEYEYCWECPNVLDWIETGKKGDRCRKAKRGKGYRIIGDIFDKIPEWCPLPDKEDKDAKN